MLFYCIWSEYFVSFCPDVTHCTWTALGKCFDRILAALGTFKASFLWFVPPHQSVQPQAYDTEYLSDLTFLVVAHRSKDSFMSKTLISEFLEAELFCRCIFEIVLPMKKGHRIIFETRAARLLSPIPPFIVINIIKFDCYFFLWCRF